MDLSFDEYIFIFSKKPKILDLARKQSTALGPGSEGNELGLLSCKSSYRLSFQSSLSPPHFCSGFLSPCPFRMRFARHWRFALLLFLHWTVRMDFAVLSQRKWKGLYHIEMSIRFPPQMRWGIASRLCPFARLASFQQPTGSTSVYDRAQ